MRRVYWNGFCNERRKRSARPSLTYEYFEMPTAIQNVYGFIIIKGFQTCVLKQSSRLTFRNSWSLSYTYRNRTIRCHYSYNSKLEWCKKFVIFILLYIAKQKPVQYNYFPFIKLQSVVIDLMKKRTKTSTFQAYKWNNRLWNSIWKMELCDNIAAEHNCCRPRHRSKKRANGVIGRVKTNFQTKPL